MHEEYQLAKMLSNSECPQLDAVEELPRVDVLDSVLRQIVPDVPDVQAKLSDVEEAQLIAGDQVESQDLGEAVLGDADSVLNLEAAASHSALLREVVVHALHSEFEELRVLLLGLVAWVCRSVQHKD